MITNKVFQEAAAGDLTAASTADAPTTGLLGAWQSVEGGPRRPGELRTTSLDFPQKPGMWGNYFPYLRADRYDQMFSQAYTFDSTCRKQWPSLALLFGSSTSAPSASARTDHTH